MTDRDTITDISDVTDITDVTDTTERIASAEAPPAPAEAPPAPAAVGEPPASSPPLPSLPPLPPLSPEQPSDRRDRRDRRVLRAALRWTAAVVAFAAVGAASAYGVTGMERTDVPGLATASDGRWDYPEIERPPLPAGSPGPFVEANRAGAHHADLRELVLPAPKGAKADPKLRGEDGWLATRTFLAEYATKDHREGLGQMLTDNGLRHITARGWTMGDGTRTRIYLLQFSTATVVDDMFVGKLTSYDLPRYDLRGVEEVTGDLRFPAASQVDGVVRVVGDEMKPYGAEQVRQAYLGAGDTVAVIVQSRKGAAAAVPFRQTVVLQSQLLS